ncbi:MAG: DUF58 domain-containing protein [Pseudomonadota bacterium]
MLSAELIKKIKKVHIRSGRMVNTLMAGQYKSVFRGSGIEFEEVREYTAGDEVKSIDWKVSARMGRPYIKRYREERERLVMMIVDMSASGNFGTRDAVKREISAEIAAILAFNAIRNNDKVGAILFTDQVEHYIPPQKGAAHVWRVIKEIVAFTPRRTGTDIENAIRYMGRVCRKKALAFLISDYLAGDYAKPLKIAAKKHEFIGVLVSDPGDFDLPEGGLVTVEDLETGAQHLLDASNEATRRWYATEKRREHERSKEILKSADIDCIDVSTGRSVTDALVKYFRYREKIKR